MISSSNHSYALIILINRQQPFLPLLEVNRWVGKRIPLPAFMRNKGCCIHLVFTEMEGLDRKRQSQHLRATISLLCYIIIHRGHGQELTTPLPAASSFGCEGTYPSWWNAARDRQGLEDVLLGYTRWCVSRCPPIGLWESGLEHCGVDRTARQCLSTHHGKCHTDDVGQVSIWRWTRPASGSCRFCRSPYLGTYL